MVRALVVAALAALAAPGAASGAPVGAHSVQVVQAHGPRIHWRDSVAVGLPEAGRLVRGVRLPPEGRHYFTWDPILKRQPDRPWRRWATGDLVHTLLHVIRDYARAHPGAPRVGIGDLSRPHGGDFGAQFGGLGHATHQNGLDADVYYPLRSEAERSPLSVDEVNLRLAQDLVTRFVRAGAVRVYVGPNTGLTGPPDVVQVIPYHDNHLHVRIDG
jgi:murein endopeptidase